MNRVFTVGSTGKQMSGAKPMTSVLSFVRKWNGWYRILRHHKGFGRFDCVRYGLWLTRG